MSMITERELKEINRHCSCGKPNFVFVKWYKWRRNNEIFMRSAGIFKYCNVKKCTWYFGNFIKLNAVHKDVFNDDECYFTATGFTLDKLPTNALEKIKLMW